MARRQSSPKQQETFAANAALLVAAAIISAPALALAATSHSNPCSKLPEATLDVSGEALIADLVSYDVPAVPKNSDVPTDNIEAVSSASLLAPRAEAAIRDAFGVDARPHTVIKSDAGTAPIRSMQTKLPGVSDVASSRYKKQMFRRDI